MVTPNKRCELDIVLDLIKEGLTKKKIKEKLGLKDTALSNQLRRLEENNFIKRVGKYKIEVLPSSHFNPGVTKNQLHKGFNKRGHAHSFSIYFIKKVYLQDLPKIKEEKELKIIKELRFGSLKLIKKGFTIWINKTNLTIYSNNSYYSKNALHSKFAALRDVDNLIQNLILKYNLPKDYGIEVFREHYGLIFNQFAKWLISKGRRMYVQDKKGKSILWIDQSRKDDVGLEEFEGEDPIIINNADTFFNSHEKHGFKVDADFTLKGLQALKESSEQNAKNLNDYAIHLKSHVESVKQLGTAVGELVSTVNELKEVVKQKV